MWGGIARVNACVTCGSLAFVRISSSITAA